MYVHVHVLVCITWRFFISGFRHTGVLLSFLVLWTWVQGCEDEDEDALDCIALYCVAFLQVVTSIL